MAADDVVSADKPRAMDDVEADDAKLKHDAFSARLDIGVNDGADAPSSRHSRCSRPCWSAHPRGSSPAKPFRVCACGVFETETQSKKTRARPKPRSRLRADAAAGLLPRCGHDADIGLRRFPALLIELFRLLVGDRPGEDEVLALLPVRRRRHPMLGGKLQGIDHA